MMRDFSTRDWVRIIMERGEEIPGRSVFKVKMYLHLLPIIML